MAKCRSHFNKNFQYSVIGQTFHPNLIQTSNLSPFLIQIPSGRTSFTGVGPMESDSVQHLEGFPMLGLRLCCCHLGILNTFWTKDLHFHFALGSAKYVGNLVNISDIPNILHPIPGSQPPYHSSYSSQALTSPDFLTAQCTNYSIFLHMASP